MANCGKNHHAVHNDAHKFSVFNFKHKSRAKTACGEKYSRPLPYVLGAARVINCHGVVKRAENTGHQHHKQGEPKPDGNTFWKCFGDFFARSLRKEQGRRRLFRHL